MGGALGAQGPHPTPSQVRLRKMLFSLKTLIPSVDHDFGKIVVILYYWCATGLPTERPKNFGRSGKSLLTCFLYAFRRTTIFGDISLFCFLYHLLQRISAFFDSCLLPTSLFGPDLLFSTFHLGFQDFKTLGLQDFYDFRTLQLQDCKTLRLVRFFDFRSLGQ